MSLPSALPVRPETSPTRPPQLMPACTACASVVSPVLPVAPKMAIFFTDMLRGRAGGGLRGLRTRGNRPAAGPPSAPFSSGRGGRYGPEDHASARPPAPRSGQGAGPTGRPSSQSGRGRAGCAPPAARTAPPPASRAGRCGHTCSARNCGPGAPPPLRPPGWGGARAGHAHGTLGAHAPLPGPGGGPGLTAPRASTGESEGGGVCAGWTPAARLCVGDCDCESPRRGARLCDTFSHPLCVTPRAAGTACDPTSGSIDVAV